MGDRFFYTVTRDAAKGMVYLKLVNASSEPQELKITLDGARYGEGLGEADYFWRRRTPSPIRSVCGFRGELDQSGEDDHAYRAGYSIQVLELGAQ